MAKSYDFTDAELAVLAQLSYLDIPVKDGQTEPLDKILEKNEAWLNDELKDGFEDVIQGLEDKVKGEDFRIVKSVNLDKDSGFSAIAICDPENNVTVACRGTEGFNIIGSDASRRDVYTDLQIGTEVETNQQRDMEIFMQELEDGDYNSYTFTGHSLGGNLAMHGAITLSDPSKVARVRTYNAPGFNAAYLAKHSFRISRVKGRMHAYQNEYDYVSSVFQTPGRHTVVKSVYSGSDRGFSHHSISGYRIDSSGSFLPNSSGKKDSRSSWVNTGTSGLVNSGWALRMAFGMITGDMPFSLSKVRDFTPEMKAMLCGAAAETENEAWWNVTRWDCWYRVQNFFGMMDWDLYAGDVDTYYRKLIDINDASVKDIEKIFSKVYALDGAFAGKIGDCAEQLCTKVNVKLTQLVASIHPYSGSAKSGGGRHG